MGWVGVGQPFQIANLENSFQHFTLPIFKKLGGRPSVFRGGFLSRTSEGAITSLALGRKIYHPFHQNPQGAPELGAFELSYTCHIVGGLPIRYKGLSLHLLFSSKRLDYVNHARRLAEDDWTGMESEEEEDKKDDEEMDIDTGKKLPKRYANQVSSPEKGRPGQIPLKVMLP